MTPRPAERVVPTRWDKKIFEFPTYELRHASVKDLSRIQNLKGHFTAKLPPLASKKRLLSRGFYYADTLVEPICDKKSYIRHAKRAFTITKKAALPELLRICHGAFTSRFHRDPHIRPSKADARYDQWLSELFRKGQVLDLRLNGRLAGFIGYDRNTLALHALDKKYRGRGLAKYFWTAACDRLFSEGRSTLKSSVSVSNLAALNLYASLGFRLKKAVDVYHLYRR